MCCGRGQKGKACSLRFGAVQGTHKAYGTDSMIDLQKVKAKGEEKKWNG